jgi:iron complex transport system substrate-binding protein
MFKKKSIITILALMLMVTVFAACGNRNNEPAVNPPPHEECCDHDHYDHSHHAHSQTQIQIQELPPAGPTITDRDGYAITLPAEINTIAAIGPSNAEILVALGFGGKIVAADFNAANVEGLNPAVATLDMFALDAESLVALLPDIVIAVDFFPGDSSPLAILYDRAEVVYISSVTSSISDIQRDIRQIGAALNAASKAEDMVAAMDAEIAKITGNLDVVKPPLVYFEIEPAPMIFTLGQGTFINELIELAGGLNAFAMETGWVNVSDEVVLARDPDVIFTNVGWMENPLEELASRPGWSALSAVQAGRVFLIDYNASSRPTHNVVIALRDMVQFLHGVDIIE